MSIASAWSRSLMATLVLMVAATSARSAVPAVDVTLEPAQIVIGDSAQLTIMTSGSGTLSVDLPVVAGLEFRVVGQSRRVQIINGAAISSTMTIVRVTPDVPGVFTIPGITPKSPPLVLHVNPDNGANAGANSRAAPNVGPPGKPPILPFGSGANASGIKLSPDGSAFVRMELPKRDIYVGESIPVEIQVGMRQGFAAPNGLPTLNSSDFTLNNLSSQPEQTAKTIDGKPFTVVTWRSLLAAVKPGDFTLNVSAPFRVRIRTQPQRESLLDDLLGDPFMQNFFGASVVKDVTVTSPASDFKVLALPTEGRPPGFTGAVGTFKISSDVSAATTTAGDPLTLRLHITGAGNFDRVDSPMFGGDDHWKSYLPKSTFKATDAAGHKGEKIFEQPLIAKHPGEQTIPELSFTYFDPNTKRYETARSAPLNVKVAPSAAETAATTTLATSGATTSPAGAPPAGTPKKEEPAGLRPDHALSQDFTDNLVPPYLQARFLAIPSAMALLFAGGWWQQRRRERGADPARRRGRRDSTTDALINEMQEAAGRGDAPQFFTAARAALQHTLAATWQIPADQITLADVDARLGNDGDDIREIFALADEANYSGDALQATDFQRWIDTVRGRLTRGTPA